MTSWSVLQLFQDLGDVNGPLDRRLDGGTLSSPNAERALH